MKIFNFKRKRSCRSCPLEFALDEISKQKKYTFQFTNNINDYEKKLDSICRVSNVRYREIYLADQWWKVNQGPLLALNTQSNQPIALLFKRNRYQMVSKLGDQKLDADHVKNLSVTAYTFYFPLDTTKLKGHFLQYIFKTESKTLYQIALNGLLASLSLFAFPFATFALFKYAISEGSLNLTSYLTIALFLSAISFTFFYFIRNLLALKVKSQTFTNLNTGLWDHLLRLPLSFFRKFSTGYLYSQTLHLQQMQDFFTNIDIAHLLSGVMSLLFLIPMFYFSPLLAFVALAFACLSLCSTFFITQAKSKTLEKGLEAESELESNLFQIIGGVHKLRVAAAEAKAYSFWKKYFAENNEFTNRDQQFKSTIEITNYTLSLLSFSTLFLVLQIKDKFLLFPKFSAFIVIYIAFNLSILFFCKTWMKFATVFPLWKKTLSLLNHSVEEVESSITLNQLQGHICLENLSFKYESEDPLVLDDLSIEIKPHEFIAIVGPSGSGKSTLLRLLLGFEKPTSGNVLIDKENLQNVSLETYRQQIGVVFQREGIMAGTIYDNITNGVTHTQDEIFTALELSGFWKDLEDMPMGLYTFLPMNGETLSGGQKQRLLLARALVGSPSILFFDEATSALDNITQNEISENISKLNVTRIVIAQRLSTIKNADKIYVLDKGKICQKGNFEDLKKTSGLFSEMLKRQML